MFIWLLPLLLASNLTKDRPASHWLNGQWSKWLASVGSTNCNKRVQREKHCCVWERDEAMRSRKRCFVPVCAVGMWIIQFRVLFAGVVSVNLFPPTLFSAVLNYRPSQWEGRSRVDRSALEFSLSPFACRSLCFGLNFFAPPTINTPMMNARLNLYSVLMKSELV